MIPADALRDALRLDLEGFSRELLNGASVGGFALRGELPSDPLLYSLYEAEAPDGNRVRIQVLPPPENRRAQRRLARALELRARLTHKALTPVLAHGEEAGRHYLVTAKSDAPTLAGVLAEKRLDPKRAVGLLRGVAAGLDFAAGRGLIHLDLRPETIRVGRRRTVWLEEFGVGLLARWVSPWYRPHVATMAPEEWNDERLEQRSNVYSLACVLFECVAGIRPFQGDVADLSFRHVAEPPPATGIELARGGVTLDDVLGRALAKMPERRYATCTELIDAAAALVPPGGGRKTTQRAASAGRNAAPARAGGQAARRDGAPARSPQRSRPVRRDPARLVTRTTPPPRRRPVVPIVVGLAAVAAGVAAGGLLAGGDDLPPPHRLTAAGVSVRLPGSWSRAPAPPTALGRPGGLAAAPAAARDVGLVARLSRTPAGTAPVGVTPTRRTRTDVVRLGRTEALRTAGLAAGGLAVTSYAVPLRDGTAELLCYRPASDRSAATGCERIASTFAARGGAAVPAGRYLAARRGADAALARFDRRRGGGRQALAHARTPAGQRRLASRLAGAYGTARRALTVAADRAWVGYGGAVIAALRDGERAARSLARAARRRSPRRFAAAGRALRRADVRLAAALDTRPR